MRIDQMLVRWLDANRSGRNYNQNDFRPQKGKRPESHVIAPHFTHRADIREPARDDPETLLWNNPGPRAPAACSSVLGSGFSCPHGDNREVTSWDALSSIND
jgi:hypothetical protein